MDILAVLTLVGQTLIPPPLPQRSAPLPPPPPPMPQFRTPPVCEAYWNAGAVFSGEVVDIAETTPVRVASAGGLRYPPGRLLSVRVRRSWRGDASGQVPVQIGPAFSRTDFKIGEEYLFYTAPHAPDLQLFPGGRTRPIIEAAQDLAYFERAERPTSGATITGHIVMDDEKKTPASGYRVRIASPIGEQTAESGPDGVFRFTGLAAGTYGIMLDAPEGLKVRGPVTITIRDPRACAEPEFTIAATGSVDLFVLDAVGKPAVRTTLELIDVDTLADSKPHVRTARTYADGSVGWGDVRVGRRYIVGLNVTQVPDPRRPQPILFYPGVTEMASAHIFEVGLGEKVHLETLRLPESPARINVVGVVLREDGTPIRAADVVLKSAARLSKGRIVGSRMRTDAQGRFSLPGIAGYRYVVEVSLSVDGENPRLYAVSDEFVLDERTPNFKLQTSKKTKLQTPKDAM